MDKDEIQRHMRAAIEATKNNPEFQAAFKQFKEETKKYAPEVAKIEEVQTLKNFFDAAKEEAANLQREMLLGEDAE